MANKIFEYGDIVYFLDSKGKIDTGTFSEDWVADGCGWSYVNQRGHQIRIWNENLFDSEINLLLSLLDVDDSSKFLNLFLRLKKGLAVSLGMFLEICLVINLKDCFCNSF